MQRNYDKTDAASIFNYSRGLLHHSLAEAVKAINLAIDEKDIVWKGKGGLGLLVEKLWYGYEPNNSPLPDFPEAGVELKTTPLKRLRDETLAIKERLVCDMINYTEIVEVPFRESPFYRKSLLMLILFYLHESGKEKRDLQFLFSVLWQLKGKDLMIMEHDYEIIISKIREGKAHEISEGDTMYLAACRKGENASSFTSQPYSEVSAPTRAFSLKAAYMRTILDFVRNSGSDMATNTGMTIDEMQLVSEKDLETSSFEEILSSRILKFKGKDYRQIARHFKMEVSSEEKSRYARVAKRMLLKGLRNFDDAEEIKKAGIIVKTIRVEANGSIRESMSFENINYQEVLETENWIDSRWYEIATSRFMFVVFREDSDSKWKDEKRYLLDDVMFWTMPTSDLLEAENFWENIRQNVLHDTLQNDNNTFWKQTNRRNFHVRPKAQTSADKHISPVSGVEVPKKCYWFNSDYVAEIIRRK